MEEPGKPHMPVIRMFGRKWRFATDDLVIPSFVDMLYRIFWLVLLSIVISTEYPATWSCEDAKGLYVRVYLIGTFAVHLVTMVIVIALARESGRGTITDLRKPVVPLLMTYLFLEIPEISLNIIGSTWLYSRIISCSLTTSFAKGVIHSIVSMTWLRLISLLLMTYQQYNPLGAIDYKDLVTPEAQEWYHEKLTKTFVSRLKWALLLVRGDKHSKQAIREIASILATLYRAEDMVYSDIVAGCILLAIRQKQLEKSGKTKKNNEPKYYSKIDEVFNGCPPWMKLEDALYYLNLSMAAYGWMFVISKNFCTRMSLIAPFLQCCFQRPDATVKGDNCCMCHYAGFKYVSKLPKKDIIYISLTNEVYEVPFHVTLNRNKKKIVVTIRGTNSLRDVVTDLAGTKQEFKVEGLPPDSYAHKGMAKCAEYVMEEVTTILAEQFVKYPNYGLVVTGHSLGAAVAILLGIKLKPYYPDVKVYAFSAPSGLLTRAASKYTESFVMTVGLGDDVVMRLSIDGMKAFKDKLLWELNATKLPKYRILLKGLSYIFRDIPDSDLDSVWKSTEELTGLVDRPVWTQSVPKEFKNTERLYNAGQILHIKKHTDSTKQEPKFTMAWTTPENFQELVVMPRMLFDHMTDNVHHAVKTIIEDNRPKAHTGRLRRLFAMLLHTERTEQAQPKLDEDGTQI